MSKNGWTITHLLWIAALLSFGNSLSLGAEPDSIRIVAIEGTAEIMPANTSRWIATQTNQTLVASDRLRVGPNSRVAILWSDKSVIRFDALTEVEILPQRAQESSGLQLLQGILSFFHREEPGRIRVVTRGSVAGIRGTEFVMAVEQTATGERSSIAVIDGQVSFSNDQGSLDLKSLDAAVAETGKAPVRSPGFQVNNVLQWCFYYPAVLDLKDLHLPDESRERLARSLASYRSGDLLGALAAYSKPEKSQSDAERVYSSALLLAVGQVEKAITSLQPIKPDASEENRDLAEALRVQIAAVKRQTAQPLSAAKTATELLAGSYHEQSLAKGDESLTRALTLARRATQQSPQFGFAWERVAELEFSFGRVGRASDALDKALALSARNAQAWALKGFLLASKNQIADALAAFNQAIAIDPGLANAWLGRGLCKMRQGGLIADSAFRTQKSAFDDLLLAAALEPQRSLLRSYLGKAYSDAADNARAGHELQLARKLDPNDPTVTLYSALLKQRENRINEAIADLEASQKLNDNRGLFRSRLLLDQDEAVRSANLASIYRDAGMTDVAVREAARAVTYDYANSSAHLFLADSYNDLRDPTRFNLRYETVWFNELLLANLLSPVGGGRLSQNVSQQEYSRLFQADGFGLANSSLYRSDNRSITEYASQFGTYRDFEYSLDLDYQHNQGVRVNNGLDSIEWYSTIKHQITPQDTFLGLIKYEDYHSGDNFQYFDPTNARSAFKFDEYQHPIAIGALHHEWSPGMHTLFLGGRLENEQHFSDSQAPQPLLFQLSDGSFVPPVLGVPFDLQYDGKLEVYTAELNQIAQWERVSFTLGGRYQWGHFKTTAAFFDPGSLGFFFDPTQTNTVSDEEFHRLTGYGYLTVEPFDRLWLTGGFAYDDISYPSNFRQPPLSPGEDHHYQTGPKGALVWQIRPEATIRGIYAQSLGGVSLDESYRLEPTQLAGFPQTFRTLISESAAGSVAAPEFEVYGGALDLKFPTHTYAGVQYQRYNSDVRRQQGFFVIPGGIPPATNASAAEVLNYKEDIITATVHQLLGEGFSVGVSYRTLAFW